jgi:hypothetical protein
MSEPKVGNSFGKPVRLVGLKNPSFNRKGKTTGSPREVQYAHRPGRDQETLVHISRLENPVNTMVIREHDKSIYTANVSLLKGDTELKSINTDHDPFYFAPNRQKKTRAHHFLAAGHQQLPETHQCSTPRT